MKTKLTICVCLWAVMLAGLKTNVARAVDDDTQRTRQKIWQLLKEQRPDYYDQRRPDKGPEVYRDIEFSPSVLVTEQNDFILNSLEREGIESSGTWPAVSGLGNAFDELPPSGRVYSADAVTYEPESLRYTAEDYQANVDNEIEWSEPIIVNPDETFDEDKERPSRAADHDIETEPVVVIPLGDEHGSEPVSVNEDHMQDLDDEDELGPEEQEILHELMDDVKKQKQADQKSAPQIEGESKSDKPRKGFWGGLVSFFGSKDPKTPEETKDEELIAQGSTDDEEELARYRGLREYLAATGSEKISASADEPVRGSEDIVPDVAPPATETPKSIEESTAEESTAREPRKPSIQKSAAAADRIVDAPHMNQGVIFHQDIPESTPKDTLDRADQKDLGTAKDVSRRQANDEPELPLPSNNALSDKSSSHVTENKEASASKGVQLAKADTDLSTELSLKKAKADRPPEDVVKTETGPAKEQESPKAKKPESEEPQLAKASIQSEILKSDYLKKQADSEDARATSMEIDGPDNKQASSIDVAGRTDDSLNSEFDRLRASMTDESNRSEDSMSAKNNSLPKNKTPLARTNTVTTSNDQPAEEDWTTRIKRKLSPSGLLEEEIKELDYWEVPVEVQTEESIRKNLSIDEAFHEAKQIKVASRPVVTKDRAQPAATNVVTPEQIVRKAIPPSKRGTRIDLDFDNTNLSDILLIMGEAGDMNILLDPALKNNTLDLHLKQITLEDALLLIANSYDLGFKLVGQALFITERDKLEYENKISRIIKVRNVNVREAKSLVEDLADKVNISEELNSLIVIGDPKDVAEVEKLVAHIDNPQPQVILEAKIIEVDKDALRDLGVDWSDQINLLYQESGRPQEFDDVEDANSGFYRIAQIQRNPLQFETTIRMLEQQNKAKVLSAPRVSTLNGKEAQIFVGDEVPYTITNITGGVVTNDVRFVEPGIRLTITPSIIEDNFVVMKVEPEVSFIVTFRGPNDEYPQVRTREATAHVRVENQQPFVLGGILNQEDKQSLFKVPFFGDLPLFGNLFSYERNTAVDTELIITVIPTVVHGRE